jgi:hypothetical protein
VTKYKINWPLAIMFVVFAVVSLSTGIAAQQATKAAKSADLIAQCTTPGTKCSRLVAEQNVQRQARTSAENKCVIVSLLDFPPAGQRDAQRETILKNYDDCVAMLTQENVATTTTTTTK